MRETPRKSVELIEGYADARGTQHKLVTFGRRLTCADLFALDGNPQAESPTQYALLQTMRKIVEFGTLRMPDEPPKDGEEPREPLTLKTLLSLDTIDADELSDAEEEFDRECAEGRQPEPVGEVTDFTIRLAGGFEWNGAVLDVVQFGNRLKVLDEAQADGLKLRGVARTCHLIGRQIVKLSASETVAEVAGPVGLDVFRTLPSSDFYALRAQAEIFRQSFRLRGAGVQG